jgi:hypothetical protein
MYDKLQWNLIEEEVANLENNEGLPQNVRDWDYFIKQYESLCVFSDKIEKGWDPSIPNMTMDYVWSVLATMLGTKVTDYNPVFVYMRLIESENSDNLYVLRKHGLCTYKIKQCTILFRQLQNVYLLSDCFVNHTIGNLDLSDFNLSSLQLKKIPKWIGGNIIVNHKDVYYHIKERTDSGFLFVKGSIVFAES